MSPSAIEAAKSRLRQAIYQRRQRLANRANREEIIKLEVLNAIDQVEANWQRILAARQNTIVNARLYEAEKREFEVGMSTSTDVLDAQFNFANAQTSEIRALADYQISLVDMAYATGTILGAARIQWEPIVPADGCRLSRRGSCSRSENTLNPRRPSADNSAGRPRRPDAFPASARVRRVGAMSRSGKGRGVQMTRNHGVYRIARDRRRRDRSEPVDLDRAGPQRL